MSLNFCYNMQSEIVKLKEIKPALAGYISESQELLKRSAMPDDEAVHDIRVLMKKARSALKLVSDQVTKDYCEKNLKDLREVGRIMASWREVSVCRRTLREFRKHNNSLFEQLESNLRIEELLKKPETLEEPSKEVAEVVAKIEELLKNSAYRIRFEQMDKIDPHLLLRELENTYNDVCGIYLFCRNRPTPGKLHEFRKMAKCLLYQLSFFRPLNSDAIKKVEKSLDNIAQNLGKYNDLNQLIRALGYSYQNDLNSPALNELVLLIREKQEMHLSNVWPSAHKLFCPGKKLVNILGFKLLVI